MKKNILFISAPIRSHILPSFYLANFFSKEYNVIYAVSNKYLEESVITNGFQTVTTSRFRAGIGHEIEFIKEIGDKLSFTRLLVSYIKNEVFVYRKRELEHLIEQIKPEAIILDVYSSTDFLFFHHLKEIKVLFFNPMPSTYQFDGYPLISDYFWTVNSQNSRKRKLLNFSLLIKYPKNILLDWIKQQQQVKLFSLSRVPKPFNKVENKYFAAFNNVPEILLLPIEFELSPKIKKSYQFYFGLCINEKRIDTEIDENFEKQWNKILKLKKENKTIIYCSFGTYFEREDPKLVSFINNLSLAVNDIPNTILICSVNNNIGYFPQIQDNILFFSKVPQLDVLRISDVFITHGGMGGIKEGIYFEVPMLVYPIDLNYDQCGNSLKVEHHKLGLRGFIGFDKKENIKNKLLTLLYDQSFKENIVRFKRNIDAMYSKDHCEKLIFNLLNTNTV